MQINVKKIKTFLLFLCGPRLNGLVLVPSLVVGDPRLVRPSYIHPIGDLLLFLQLKEEKGRQVRVKCSQRLLQVHR